MNQEARTKLMRARISMIMKQPFFGQLALRLKLVENDKLNPPTAATNGMQLIYHPQWVLDNDHDTVVSMVAHEVGHCIFQHIGRRSAREPRRWNQAGDYVINAVLKDSGFVVPDTWLYDPIYAGLSTDQVYRALPPQLVGLCGPSGAGDKSDPFDEILDELADGVDPDVSAQDWEIATVQAATAADAQGKLPGSLKRFVGEITRTKVDWRAVLRRFMTDSARDDYSYARLNRRFASLGIYLPGLYSEAMGEICAVIDTSGSISDEILSEFGAEIADIRSATRPTMTRLMYCDADVNHVDEFDQFDDFKVTFHGGGGTDFRPPFHWLQKRDLEPKVLVYLTDGYGPFPTKSPDYPVLWLMTTDVIPPWGEVVRIET